MKKGTWAVLFGLISVAYFTVVYKVGYAIGQFFGEKLFS